MEDPISKPPPSHGCVVVTGAAGFIGRHLVRQLLDAGHAVRAVTRDPDQLRRNWPDGWPAESTAPALQLVRHPGVDAGADWQPLLAGAVAVVHGAGIAHVPLDANRSSQRQLWRVNVRGPRQLALAAARAGVKQMIFLSSIKAAGEWSTPGHPLREDDPPRPEDCYGYAKLAAERHLQRLSINHGGRLLALPDPLPAFTVAPFAAPPDRNTASGRERLRITTIRPPLVYGPGVKANFAALQKLAASGLPLPLGRVNNARCFLGIDNLCDAILQILAHPERAGGLYHLSDGPAVSTPALIRAMADAAGRPVRLLDVPPGLMAGLTRLIGKPGIWQRLAGTLAVDNQRFCRQFGWTPPVPLEEGLRRMQNGGS